METKLRLLMTFEDSTQRRVSLSIDDPRPDLTEEEIKNVMDLIVEKDVFSPKGGSLEVVLEAKILETSTTSHDLVL
ncbi:MAG: DUF2922 domain-containing protein [Romboutsia sp.]